MDPWKYAVIWLLPGAVLVGICISHRAWRKSGVLKFFMWCTLILAMGPFFMVGLAYINSRR